MSRALKCGCEIESDYSYEEGRTVDCSTIIFCELHEAAPALLEACSRLVNVIQDGINVYDANQFSWLAQQESYQDALTAIAKASSVPIGTPKVDLSVFRGSHPDTDQHRAVCSACGGRKAESE